MTMLTTKARMQSFPLDQLLAIGRRLGGLCLYCGEEQWAGRLAKRQPCGECRQPFVYHVDEIIIGKYAREP